MTVTGKPKLPRARQAASGGAAPGLIVGDKYVIESVVGSGGMAQVFAARRASDGHRVALKMLHASDDELHARRLLREAEVIASLRSEFVTRVLDVGTLSCGAPYLVMELLDGIDLSTLLRARERLSVREVATYLSQACAAVDEAHRLGIVHRDLKPSNLFLTRRANGTPLIKLMDFGISKPSTACDDALTRTQDVLGTPHYMAPEQILSSQDVDARADVWALGAILYRMLTGRCPFDGRTAAAVLALIATAPTPRLRELCPEAPHELEWLLRRSLEKLPTRRLATAAAFACTLLPFADEETRHLLRDAFSETAGRGKPPTASRPPKRSAGRRAIVPLIAGLLGALAFGAIATTHRPGAIAATAPRQRALPDPTAKPAGPAEAPRAPQEVPNASAKSPATPAASAPSPPHAPRRGRETQAPRTEPSLKVPVPQPVDPYGERL